MMDTPELSRNEFMLCALAMTATTLLLLYQLVSI